jgi:hypothetical protein
MRPQVLDRGGDQPNLFNLRPTRAETKQLPIGPAPLFDDRL